MRVGPVVFLAALPVGALAQTQASVGAGVGTVRYAGGSTFGAATVSPAAQWLTPSLYLGASGGVSILPGSVWAGQARADLWAAVPRVGVGRAPFAVSANAAANTRSDGAAAGAAVVIGERVWVLGGGGRALGAGVSTGVIEGSPGITALRLRARTWWQAGSIQPSLSIESTGLRDGWYTDVTGSATVDRGRIVASVWAGARVGPVYGSIGVGSVAIQYFVTASVALEGAAGSYLDDPFQGLPRAGFATVGVRLHRTPRPLGAPPAIAPRLAPLIAQRRGDSVVVRFRMDGAQGVAIAGDWNAWQPAPLRPLGGEIWEGAFVLSPGSYYFSLLVDGTEWVVPGGVVAVPDGMGGRVAVLTVL